MSYESVDKLQKILSDQVFHYTNDKKKAAGRALGTLVEIITFYLLRSWGFRESIGIERIIPEYANSEITHNVEYSIHPIINQFDRKINNIKLPITSAKIRESIWGKEQRKEEGNKSNQLLTSKEIMRNCCTIIDRQNYFYVAHLNNWDGENANISIAKLYRHPYAIFECKRVGVEEGAKKGPQTIEQAKQGAYVARSVSSLQKIRLKDGRMGGILHPYKGELLCLPYEQLINKVLKSTDRNLLYQFTLSVGIVSNHGNWFTSQDHNKELKVLAQSYDWLLFLTDLGLAQFVDELLLNPKEELESAKNAFLDSYTGKKGNNRFTKVQMDAGADRVLVNYFSKNQDRIASWFNIISPKNCSLYDLKESLGSLRGKDWTSIHNIDRDNCNDSR